MDLSLQGGFHGCLRIEGKMVRARKIIHGPHRHIADGNVAAGQAIDDFMKQSVTAGRDDAGILIPVPEHFFCGIPGTLRGVDLHPAPRGHHLREQCVQGFQDFAGPCVGIVDKQQRLAGRLAIGRVFHVPHYKA